MKTRTKGLFLGIALMIALVIGVFSISAAATDEEYVPVTGIKCLESYVEMNAGTFTGFSTIVYPENASNKQIMHFILHFVLIISRFPFQQPQELLQFWRHPYRLLLRNRDGHHRHRRRLLPLSL